MPGTWISTYAEPLATIGAAALVVVVTPLLGAWAYFKRKEHEIISRRYLENGVEEIIKHVERGLAVFEYNWAICIHLLRIYRDLGSNMILESHQAKFAPTEKPISLEASRHYLLVDLVGDKVFFDAHQLLGVFLHKADTLFKDDLCSAIRVSLTGGIEGTEIAPPEEIFQSYSTELERIHKDVECYYVLLGQLQLVASQLAKKQYTFKELRKFRQNNDVQSIVTEMKAVFKDQLEESSHDDSA